MIVLDASAVVEMLMNSPAGQQIWHRIASPEASLHAPQLLDVEVLSAIRRNALSGNLPADRCSQAVTDLADLPVIRYPHEPFRSRIWELRTVLSAYDATYVALAEALDAPLVSLDARLAGSRGHRARIELVRAR